MSLLTGGPDSQLLISTSGNGAAENVSPPTGRTVLLTLTQASRPSFRFAQAGLQTLPYRLCRAWGALYMGSRPDCMRFADDF